MNEFVLLDHWKILCDFIIMSGWDQLYTPLTAIVMQIVMQFIKF